MLKRTTLATLRLLGGQPGYLESLFLRLLKSPPWEETIANNITMARMRIGFWGIHGFYWPYVLLPQFHWAMWGTLSALIIAASLDAVDGKVARKLNCETAFGRFIDPLSDKVIAWSGFCVLLNHYDMSWCLVAPATGIVLYDILVSWTRIHDKNMRTNLVAKFKQWPLDIGIGMLLVGVLIDWNVAHGFDVDMTTIYTIATLGGTMCLWAALILATISAYIYTGEKLVRTYYDQVPMIQRITILFF